MATRSEYPGLGRIVHYKAKTRGYELPAIVTATPASIDPTGVELGHVPALTGPDRVHLHVLTCGEQESYQEFDVPVGDQPGTWHWPALT